MMSSDDAIKREHLRVQLVEHARLVSDYALELAKLSVAGEIRRAREDEREACARIVEIASARIVEIGGDPVEARLAWALDRIRGRER